MTDLGDVGLHGGHGPAETAHALADLHQLPLVDLKRVGVDKAASDAIPRHVLERALAVPYRFQGDLLQVAVADPGNVQAVDDLKLATAHQLEFVVAAQEDIELVLQRLARTAELDSTAAIVEEDSPLDAVDAADLESEDGISDAPPIRLVNSIILRAAKDGASDIHLVPRGDGLAVRLRLDGVMHEIDRIPKRHASGVVTRIKVLAKLDVAEHRQPQDGRMSVTSRTAGRLLEIRVAVLPTVNGEGVILRLLDKSKQAPTLTEIGLPNDMQMALEQIVNKPSGALLVTGPTGSGKSTTLYATLSDLRRPETSIITIEDPVEYRLDDVYQLQVNPRGGLTFASGLRAILRSDPDIVMVGEIRDLETARISLGAASTGHLMLFSMHTNDAPSALTRLNEMGIESFVTGSAITAVLAQRLVRTLCKHCKEAYRPSHEVLKEWGFPDDQASEAEGLTLYRSRGCGRCSKGYKGRIGIFQLMVMNDELRHLAAERATREELERCALEHGMRTLWEHGLAKVAAGLTTIEELERVAR